MHEDELVSTILDQARLLFSSVSLFDDSLEACSYGEDRNHGHGQSHGQCRAMASNPSGDQRQLAVAIRPYELTGLEPPQFLSEFLGCRVSINRVPGHGLAYDGGQVPGHSWLLLFEDRRFFPRDLGKALS